MQLKQALQYASNLIMETNVQGLATTKPLDPLLVQSEQDFFICGYIPIDSIYKPCRACL